MKIDLDNIKTWPKDGQSLMVIRKEKSIIVEACITDIDEPEYAELKFYYQDACSCSNGEVDIDLDNEILYPCDENGWIKSISHKPEPQKDVLTFHHSKEISVGYHDGLWICKCKSPVSDWQPLPEQPKEKP